MNSYIGQSNKNTLNKGGCWLLKHREFVYVGEPVPTIDNEQHEDFILNYQRSILLALVKRNLLTLPQCEKCIEKLENQYSALAKP